MAEERKRGPHPFIFGPAVKAAQDFEDSRREVEAILNSETHATPPNDEALTPCCGKTPFELSRWDRMTLDPELVTCGTT